MEQENKFKCSGNCLNCHEDPIKRKNQWHYCAAQFTYNTMRMVGDMQESLKSMQGTIDELKLKVEAIQNSEADVFDPTKENSVAAPMPLPEDTAQKGDGVEE